MNPQQFTTKSQEAIQRAFAIAQENGQQQIEPSHLFFALLEQEEGVALSVLKKLNINILQLKAAVQVHIDHLPKVTGAGAGGIGQIFMSHDMAHLLNAAGEEMQRMGDAYISTEHMLLAFANAKNPLQPVFEKFGIDHASMLRVLATVRGTETVDSPEPESKYN
ncbi:MAG: Clp protease N-terminal domain-containing protein, partial [Patescibacteria group bacterium]